MKKLFFIPIIISLFFFTSCEKDEEINGCTDAAAVNYDSNATNDDGSCQYNFIKRWTITSFTANGGDISSPGDYIEFFTDGSYLSYTGGIFELGTFTSTSSSITFSTFEIDGDSVYVTYSATAFMSNANSLTLTGSIDGVNFVITAVS